MEALLSSKGMDIVQANLIEKIVDEKISKHHKIIELEKNSAIIKQTLFAGEKRMDKMEDDISNIKESQMSMSNNITAITKTLNGNGIRGLAGIVEDNTKRMSELITITTVNSCDITRIDKISWIIGSSFVASFIGLVIYLARMSMIG